MTNCAFQLNEENPNQTLADDLCLVNFHLNL